MKTIKLTKNLFAKIDDEDIDRISKFSWYAHKSTLNHFYAATRGKENSELKLNQFVYLHRFIIKAEKNQIVDHINGDILDNRKLNLRITDPKGNCRNSKKTNKKTSSVYKGVHFNKLRKTWVAQILGKHIGTFKSEKEAALAYNEKVLQIYGTFGKINLIKEDL